MTSEEYVKLQDVWLKATDIKKGDWVKVTRKADSHESGWDNSWEPEMDAFVGQIVKVKDGESSGGIEVVFSETEFRPYRFPFFVLEPAEALKGKYQFKPFEQVLTRDEDTDNWVPDLFRFMNDNNRSYPFNCLSNMWKQCVPYAGHEALLGTTDEPENWEKYYDKSK